MNAELIARTWGAIHDHVAFVKAVYARFFERFPAYRRLFPHRLRRPHRRLTFAGYCSVRDFPRC